MFTVCPKCSLKLVVTAADLRVAQGHVRCGRCSNVFNALVGLSDEQQAVLAREERAAAAGEQSAPPPDRPPDPPAGPRHRPGAPIPDAALEFDAAATDVSEVFIEPQVADHASIGQSETLILRSEHPASLDATDEFELADFEPPPDASAAPGPYSTSPAPSVPGPGPAPEALPAPAPSPELIPTGSAGALALDGLSTAAEAGPATRRLDRVLQFGSAALALLLAVQIVDHYRATLADIDWLRPPLTALYARLGIPLAPHWDVGAYEVRQLGAIAGPENPGALTVRASIKNTAPRPQPLPLLRVTVQDRFGNRVAARDVPPGAYLPRASASRGYLAAGQRVDAEIALVDPGPNAVGFEIDACLADAAGRVSCANGGSSAP